MKILFRIMLVLVLLLLWSGVNTIQAQTKNKGYLVTTESSTAYTDTTASTTTNDTTDYYFKVNQPANDINKFNVFLVEVKQNSTNKTYMINYPDPEYIRFRYLAADSSGYCQVYGQFGWMDVSLSLPGNTSTEGSTAIPFTLKTGSAIWSVRAMKWNLPWKW